MDNLISHYKFLCRICTTYLDKDVNFKKIFEENINNSSLTDIILAVSSLTILPNDNLPDKICTQCLESLKLSYEFREMCKKSDLTLRTKLDEVFSSTFLQENELNSNRGEDTTKCENSLKSGSDFEVILLKSENEEDAKQNEFICVDNNQRVECQKDWSKTGNHINVRVDNKVFRDCTSEYEEDLELKSNRTREKIQIKSSALSCPTCSKTFNKSFNFKRHLINIHAIKSYSCKPCKSIFINKDNYLKHKDIGCVDNKGGNNDSKVKTFTLVKDESTEEVEIALSNANQPRSYECKFCKEILCDEHAIEEHTKIHNENIINLEISLECLKDKEENKERKPLSFQEKVYTKSNSTKYECNICLKIFPKLSALIRHKKTHRNQHKCETCKEFFPSKTKLSIHVKGAHKGVKPFPCKMCDKGFYQASRLEDHIRAHNKDSSYLCSECGKAFTNSSNLRQHAIRHSGVKPYECPECPKKFPFKSGLSAHMTTHTQLKPFSCDTCGSLFTTSYSLIKHNRIHTGERPYGCEVCGMRFNSSYHLKRHIRTHTGEKPFTCKYCPRAFTQKNDLVKHVRTHLGGKSYLCEECPASFKFFAELKSHIQDHYKKNKNHSI